MIKKIIKRIKCSIGNHKYLIVDYTWNDDLGKREIIISDDGKFLMSGSINIWSTEVNESNLRHYPLFKMAVCQKCGKGKLFVRCIHNENTS